MAPGLIRNAERVKASLRELPTGQLVTTRACKIQVPERFSAKGLADIGIDTHVYGIFALIMDDGFYAVSLVNAMMKVEPYKVLTEVVRNVPYHTFYFEAGQVVISNLNLVCRDVLIYSVLDELIFNGKIPWYLQYEDLGKLFDTAKRHASSNVAQNYEVIELIASMLTRVKEDRTQYYRNHLESYEAMVTSPPAFVPMKSVFYSASNTLNKLAGNYFTDGIVSALVNPSTEVQHLEQLLRS